MSFDTLNKLKNYYASVKLAKYQCKFASGITSLGKHAELVLEPHVSLGRVAIFAGSHFFGANSYMRSGGELYGNSTVGRFCSIGSNVIIGLEKNKHPTNWLSTALFSKAIEEKYLTQASDKPTSIGNDCWIGRDALIMSGVTIGDGAIIGARALVTSDVPPYAIYAGIPARLIRYRFSSELIEKFLAAQWWNFSIEQLQNLTIDQAEICLEQLNYFDKSSTTNYSKLTVSRQGVQLNKVL
jgi:chloramphenicol O-acetyltransferase type B